MRRKQKRNLERKGNIGKRTSVDVEYFTEIKPYLDGQAPLKKNGLLIFKNSTVIVDRDKPKKVKRFKIRKELKEKLRASLEC